MIEVVVGVFVLVYAGMVLGGLPLLQLDRTGIALLGAIALIAVHAVSLDDALRAVHLPTVVLLFAFMVISAQMRLAGFYDEVTRRIAAARLPPAALLGLLMAASAALSAVFSNDIVCLAVAPVLVDACRGRGLDPRPFLLALACAANIGSAATLIGNPQNMLIGETLHLSFAGYARDAAAPVALGLLAAWALVVALSRAQLRPGASADAVAGGAPFDRWQAAKGGMVVAGIAVCFVATDWPRAVVALTGAGVLLTSRRLHSRRMLGLVDWSLLVLFGGLFVVNAALQATGLPARVVAEMARAGLPLQHPAVLAASAFGLSNLVSNVPAVMLLLPSATAPLAGPTLALVSTLAGNLLVVGSVANLIVLDAAARRGIALGWREHARIGVPVTVVTLAIVALNIGLALR